MRATPLRLVAIFLAGGICTAVTFAQEAEAYLLGEDFVIGIECGAS